MCFRLDTFNGVFDFLTAIYKVEQELKMQEKKSFRSPCRWSHTCWDGERYTTCRDLLQALPKEQQTKEVFGQRLLEAEKNEKINAEIALLTMGASVNAATNPRGTHLLGPSTRKVCGYIRKRQGRNAWNKPGQECLKYHTGSAGEALRRVAAANPTKTPADLPDRLQALGPRGSCCHPQSAGCLHHR